MTKTLSLCCALFSLVACGGGASSPTPVATPTPPMKAAVTFNLDPKVQTAEYQGNGYWKFKVNMEFVETGGVGFMINTCRVTLASPTSGAVLLDYNYAMAAHVDPMGRKVFQWTSPQYFTNFNTGQATVKMVADITDDKGNSIMASNSMTVSHVAGPRVELPR